MSNDTRVEIDYWTSKKVVTPSPIKKSVVKPEPNLFDGEWIELDEVAETKVEVAAPKKVALGSLQKSPAGEAGKQLPTAPREEDKPELEVKLDIPLPGDVFWLTQVKQPFPSWVKEFRPEQYEAAMNALECFNSGAKIVWLDAPTGTGKTLVGEMVRRGLGKPAWYVPHTKTLQDQFAKDFSYSQVLKGRSNYPTLDQPYPEYTAADCTKTGGEDSVCFWCHSVSDCPYEIAKTNVLKSDIGVLNLSYLLTEGNYIGKIKKQQRLAILDECDTAESGLMGFVTYSLPERRLDALGLEAPRKGVRKKTIQQFLVNELNPQLTISIKGLDSNSTDIRVVRELSALKRLKAETEIVIASLDIELERIGTSDEDSPASNWIRDNDAGPLVLKPVRIDAYGGQLWGLADQWLCMSATIVSTDEINDSLGVNLAQIPNATIQVPMKFPVENRKIVVAPLENNTMANRDKAWPVIMRGVKVIMDRHPNERILVHTVSYNFASYLMKELRSNRCVTYSNARDREEALRIYRRREGSVLLASSMDRGVDLKDDDCRVVVVAKMPYLSLGDRQVSARLRGPGGQTWYNVQTVRTLIQMTGRGVRSKDDWCVTYILDSSFLKKIWNGCRSLLPKWWQEAVEVVRVSQFK